MAVGKLKAIVRMLDRFQQRLDMEWLSIVIVFTLSIISFIATFFGFRIFFSTDETSIWGVLMPLLLTLVIQSAILYSVWNLKSGKWASKPFWMIVYLLCVFFSVAFGYGFWFERIRVGELSKELALESEELVRRPINVFIAQYQDLAKKFEKISAHSTQMSIDEEEKGGTCHPDVPRGRGQMANYRAADALLFSDLNLKMQDQVKSLESTLNSTLSGEMVQLTMAAQKRVLNALVARLQAKYKPHEHFEQLVTAIESQIIQAETQVWSVVYVNGSRQSKRVMLCAPDAEQKREQLALLNSIEVPTPPSFDDIVLIDANNPRESINYAFGGLVVTAFRVFGFEPPFGNSARLYQQRSADMIPLWLGLMVDILIMLFGRRMNPRQVEANQRLGKLGSSKLLEHLTKLFPGRSEAKLAELFEGNVVDYKRWWSSHKKVMVIPQNSSDRDLLRLQDFLDRLKLHKLCRMDTGKLFSALPSIYQRKVNDIRDPVRKRQILTNTYNVYFIDAELLIDIKDELFHRSGSGKSPLTTRRAQITT